MCAAHARCEGTAWLVANAVASGRAAYGFTLARLTEIERSAHAGWTARASRMLTMCGRAERAVERCRRSWWAVGGRSRRGLPLPTAEFDAAEKLGGVNAGSSLRTQTQYERTLAKSPPAVALSAYAGTWRSCLM
jgi:hypothetical protein